MNCYGKQVIPQVNRITMWSSNSTLKYTNPRESKIYLYTKTCSWTFTAALIIIAPKWKHPKSLSVDEWISKMWCTHITEYHLAIRRKERLICAATRMNLHVINAQDQIYCKPVSCTLNTTSKNVSYISIKLLLKQTKPKII